MSLEGIWPPLCMAKTVKLQGRHAALLLYSASCQTQMTSYHSDSCCLVSGTIMSLRLGAVLNFCRSSLTYSANTLAQSYKQEWRVSPTKHFGGRNSSHSSGMLKNPPRRSLDWQVSSPPAVSSEVCPGILQPDWFCNTRLVFKITGLKQGREKMFLPVVEERLRVFEDVTCAASSRNRCFIQWHFKLWMEQVSDHTVGNEWSL